MYQAPFSPLFRFFRRIGLAAVLVLLCHQVLAEAGDLRRCRINGQTVITNLSCDQLAAEAGIAPPASEVARPSSTPKPAIPSAPPPTQTPAAAKAAQRSLDALLWTLLSIGLAALLVAALVAWLRRRAVQESHDPLPTTHPAFREPQMPSLATAATEEDETLPYRQAPVMSRYELEMFERLKSALPECDIFPQVPLASFIRVDIRRAGSRYATNSYRWQNRIGQQRVDFLACLRRDMSTVAAIELDDPSHETASARRRDAKKDKSLNDAHVPLIRWRVEAMPDAAEIRQAFVRLGLLGAEQGK